MIRRTALKSGYLILALGIAMITALTLVVTLQRANETGDNLAYGGSETSFHYGAKSLVGATSEQVGEYALEYAENNLGITGKAQVVLAQPFTDADWQRLGLGCAPSKIIIEEPPMTLVILKGDFNVTGAVRGATNGFPLHNKYVAYVFDHWSAASTAFLYSLNGGRFRVALNDPHLPFDNPAGDNLERFASCPTPIPYTPVLHYGDTIPTASAPSAVPPTEHLPAPSKVVPSPVATGITR